VIRGVRIGPSPEWLAKRLETLGIPVINNVVDITNYVMMECGQPLHAFDYARLEGQRIIVREATKDEPFVAIDHKTYALQPGMCVIADQAGPVALGGVMGGETSEVSASTTDLLIESADFAPLAIRSAARALRLHSPSSYRFERGVDPEGIDWASRRACELIAESAGGEILAGVVDVQPVRPASHPQVVLRMSQIPRILGIELDQSRVKKILEKLGLDLLASTDSQATWIAPSWRRDLNREIDLIEEVARIHGYDEIPENVAVPMVPSYRSDGERMLEKVRQTLVAAEFFEAITSSLVDEKTSACFSPWSNAAPLRSNTPTLRGADCLRRSLVPSLLASRHINQSLANARIELFETANVYLPTPDPTADAELLDEEFMLAITSGGDFKRLKGVLEAILDSLSIDRPLRAELLADDPLLDRNSSCQLNLGSELLGYLGEVQPSQLTQFGLRARTTVAEIKLSVLLKAANLVPQHQRLSAFPAITHDLNLIVAESVRWNDMVQTVRTSGKELLEDVIYRETYRDAKKDGTGKKRLIFSLVLRSPSETLTGQRAEKLREVIVEACKDVHGAELL